MFACVARQERMWKGESMDISKCLRLDGSVASGFDNLITICRMLASIVRSEPLRD